MKIATHYMESIAGVEIYPLISLIVFFLFFMVVTIYAVRLDKGLVDELSNMPSMSDKMEISDRNASK